MAVVYVAQTVFAEHIAFPMVLVSRQSLKAIQIFLGDTSSLHQDVLMQFSMWAWRIFWWSENLQNAARGCSMFLFFLRVMWIFSMWRCFKRMTKYTSISIKMLSVSCSLLLARKISKISSPTHKSDMFIYTIHRTNMGILKAQISYQKILGFLEAGDVHRKGIPPIFPYFFLSFLLT